MTNRPSVRRVETGRQRPDGTRVIRQRPDGTRVIRQRPDGTRVIRQRPDGTRVIRQRPDGTGVTGQSPSDDSSPDLDRVEGRPHPIQDSIHRAPSPRQAELGCTRRGRATPCSSSTEPRQLFIELCRAVQAAGRTRAMKSYDPPTVLAT